MKTLLENIARTVVKSAQALAPIKTGELRASIDILSVSKSEAVVGHKLTPKIVVNHRGAQTIYPLFVHEGTDPYTITPKSPKKALFWKGAKHPIRRVNHQGIKANPYFEKSLKSKAVDAALEAHGDWLLLEIEKSIK